MFYAFASLLQNRNFRNLWLGQILSQIALNMLYFVLAIYVYDVTRSNTIVSSLLLTFGVPAIVFGIIAGSIVDLFDKRSILLVCNLSRMAVFLALFFFFKNIPALFFLSLLISLITQLFIPAEGPSIPLLVSKKELLTANSLFSVSFYLSTLIGFILAGPALRWFGSAYVFLPMIGLVGGATYCTSLLPSLTEKTAEKQTLAALLGIRKKIAEGIAFIRKTKRVEQSLLLLTLSQALIATVSVLAPGFADRVLHIDLRDTSVYVMGPAAVGLMIGSLAVGELGKKYLKGSIVLIGIIAAGGILMLLSFSSSHTVREVFYVTPVYFAMTLLFLLGLCNALIAIPANTILQQDSLIHMRGRVYGVLTSLTGGVSLLPVILGGILADIIGVSKTLFLIGSIVGMIGIYHLKRRREI